MQTSAATDQGSSAERYQAASSWAMQHIALEARGFVLSANQFAPPARLSGRLQHALRRRSRHRAVTWRQLHVGPLGNVLAGPDCDGETILTADVDRSDIARARLDFDAVGHYARPKVFSLIVDETARTPVAFRTGPTAVPPSGSTSEDR